MRLRKSFQVIFSEISEGLIGYYGKFVCKHIGVYIFEYIYIYIKGVAGKPDVSERKLWETVP